MYRLKRLFVGTPLPTAQARHERLSKRTGLAIFASDNLSSVAYATEEIMRVLILAGVAALSLSTPISIAIGAVICIVIYSYRQTIVAYPQGASDYIVAKDNLGTAAGLVAGSALLIDYTLTVAVSVSAGIAAVTSAVPGLFPYRVVLCVAALALIAYGNLRGLRESGRLFALPSYLFIAGFLVLIATGFARYAIRGEPTAPPTEVEAPLGALSVFLVLRAFASGAVALTGIEAVADGVQAFKPPEVKNARTVLAVLGIIMLTLFIGTTALADLFNIVPRDEETVVSQLARAVFGGGPLYYYLQGVSTLILILAANTAFADFPRLAFFMSRDGYLPRQFGNRGDRLVFSNGVVLLAVIAAGLVVVFHGSTHALIPLYAVGVFTSFTLSQTSMVRRWLRTRPDGWWWRVAVNGIGGATTAVVLVVVAATKFVDGAWIVVVLIGFFILTFLAIRHHYDDVARQLSLEGYEGPPPISHSVLVLVGDLHRGVAEALQYAKTLSPEAKAVYVELDPERTRRLEERWVKHGLGVPLIVLTSPYRSLLGPFLGYIDHLVQRDGRHIVTIVLPEFIPARWWQHLLHNQTALLIKGALLFRKNVIVTDVPYHLKD
ncbi:MAG: amino acid permease [Candidatus Rokubacteria bacterium RIFCSPHIGHO2_12_FULL_73_22]|nr:MAG: amino acid permease [Candidatus Rokubacteria bacterium RIFCSPHIGHO2_12_FULL_73_22]OGL21334.1 MAG: amino acid permease [Candidatus Rokubacteria bacterium RIFCSPLOWO2_12_FULL_73_47]